MTGTELLLGGMLAVLVAVALVLALRLRAGSAPDVERGLRAELRHLVELGYLLGRRAPDELPDWDTLVVTGPKETTDANGRMWFEYSATVHAPLPRPKRS